MSNVSSIISSLTANTTCCPTGEGEGEEGVADLEEAGLIEDDVVVEDDEDEEELPYDPIQVTGNPLGNPQSHLFG